MLTIGMVIFTILITILLAGLSGLIFWGIGCLIISVFGITYTWTFWHGLCIALVVAVLKEIFGRN